MSASGTTRLIAPEALKALVERLFPSESLVKIAPLKADAGTGTHEKAAGYGQVLRLTLEKAAGEHRHVTFHTVQANEYGHDRLADRAAQVLQAAEDFNQIPLHVRALDAGAVRADGSCTSLTAAPDFYVVASWAEGDLYVDDLRRLSQGGELAPRDLQRCEAVANWLSDVHSERIVAPIRYRRALRDLLGSGEGIFGVVDAYPGHTPAAPPERLEAIERLCLQWRWRLHTRVDRLRRTHGDAHPFNLVFDGDSGLTALDASRGAAGDPADDVTALAINYVFFALGQEDSWRRSFRRLWNRFWTTYLERTRDVEVLEVLAPYLAWRILVVGSPRFYPDLSKAARDKLFSFAERTLNSPRFDPAWADALFP